MRLKHYINTATARLTKAGVDSPRLCVEVLAREALDGARETSARLFCLLEAERELDAQGLYRLEALVDRRATGIPLSHITGTKEFYGRDFFVTPHTLIPRPETELLVDTALELLPCTPLRFADLGAGTGCIGLTLAAERPNWRGLLLDISAQALAVAGCNAERLAVADRAALLAADMLRPPLARQSFGLVVANPPYIAEAERHMVMAEVLRNEPHNALFSEQNGLLHLKAAVWAAADALHEGGLAILEHGAAQGPEVRAMFEATGIFKKIETKRDIAGLERCTLAQKGL